MSVEQSAKQLAAEAKAANVSLTALAQMIVGAWNEPEATPYGPDGMSHPATGTGLVRFRELDEQRLTYLADGQLEAANALRYSYACYPGAIACEPGSIEQYCAGNNTSTATFLRGLPGMGGQWYQVHPAKAVSDIGGTHYTLDGNVVIADAFAIPYQEFGTGKPINRTAAECVAFMLANAKQFVK